MILPKPYYQDESGVIYHGDCLEIMPMLPDKSVDLVLTDPPYGLNFNNGDLAHCREKVFEGGKEQMPARPIENDGEQEAEDNLRAALIIIKEKLLKGGACCCCCCGGGGPKPLFARWTLMLDEIIGFKMAVVWDKGGLGMGIHYRRNYEFILIAQNGAPAHRWNGGNKTPNVWRIAKIIPSANQHPTQKPVALFKKAIGIHANKGDLILDPFLGSGTTAVAAKEMGCKYIGIEICEKYCEIAAKRLAQKVMF